MKFVEKDGRTYLVAQAIMSKIYAKWAYDVFVDDEDNYRSVSMEITVLGTEVNDDDGLEHITKFVFNGVTLLGESHMPACEGANASIIKFSKENALKVYSKRLKNSDKIKKDFVKDMELAEGLRKEESEKMDEKEKVVETVEEEKVETPVAEEAKEEETFEEKSNSDEDTYMEDEKCECKEDKMSEDEKSDEESEEEKEDDKEDDDDKDEEDMECGKDFESLTVEQKYEVFRSAVKESLNGCGYLETYDDEYLYIYDYCENNTFRYSYTLDGTNCTIDVDSKTRVMRGGYVEFEEYEENNTKFEALEKENCELKEKLAAYETAEKDKSVEAILSKVIDVLPAERIAELREEAVNYSLDNLSVFENEVKAIAFEVVADQVKGKKYSFERMPVNDGMEHKTSKYGW